LNKKKSNWLLKSILLPWKYKEFNMSGAIIAVEARQCKRNAPWHLWYILLEMLLLDVNIIHLVVWIFDVFFLLLQDEINNELETLFSRQCHLEAKLHGITKMLPNLQIVHCDAEQLSEMITFTSTLAENVSAKVRQLDIARVSCSTCIFSCQ
jgi:hypothetical protein